MFCRVYLGHVLRAFGCCDGSASQIYILTERVCNCCTVASRKKSGLAAGFTGCFIGIRWCVRNMSVFISFLYTNDLKCNLFQSKIIIVELYSIVQYELFEESHELRMASNPFRKGARHGSFPLFLFFSLPFFFLLLLSLLDSDKLPFM